MVSAKKSQCGCTVCVVFNLLLNFTSQKLIVNCQRFDNYAVVFISGGVFILSSSQPLMKTTAWLSKHLAINNQLID